MLDTPPASGTATPTTTSLTATQAIKAVAANASPQLAPLDASKLQMNLTSSPRAVPAPDSPEYKSSSVCTDHMITCSWTASSGWANPSLVPFGPLSLAPTASVLHYATACFEGLKLYRGHDGKLRLFRPGQNCQRMALSAARIALPVPDPAQLEELIVRLASVDGTKWLPSNTHKGKFLYVRPTLIADDATLGVQRPQKALLYVILTLFPDLSDPSALSAAADDGIRGLRLLASREDTVRAWPGGFGSAKLGANYGPTLLAQGEARQRGFNQVLWLLGSEARVTEAGASNFFVVMRSEQGRDRLVTAPLGDGVILHGVTRGSILNLARERLAVELEVEEGNYTMGDLVKAKEEGRLVEAFAAGTAFFVAPVGLIEWKGEQIKVPMEQGTTGKYAALFRGWLEDIMYGRTQHEWGLVVPEENI